ncbi:MAG TPA: MarR family transcriptional regulator [Pseudonocardiaceae bacterium]|jgi:DNA-binding MarR family transcriptional regulator
MADGADETLSEAFWRVARLLRHRSGESLARWDIAPSHGRALGVLARHGPARLRELSEHLHIAARSATEVVDALQERGLVQRRPDPADRRATLVVLTPKGQQVSTAIQDSRAEDAQRLFGALSASDRAELARILAKLHD